MNTELRWAVLRSSDDAAGGVLRCKGYDIDPGIGPYGGFIVDMVERTDPKGREVLGPPRIIEDLGKQWDPVDHTRQIMVVVRVHKQYPCRPTKADVEGLAQRFGWSIIRTTEAHLRSMTGGVPEYEVPAPVMPESAAPPVQAVDAEVAAAKPKKRGPGNEHKHLQRIAKQILANGGPPIRLTATAAVLRQYIADNSQYAQHKADEDRRPAHSPGSGAPAEVG